KAVDALDEIDNTIAQSLATANGTIYIVTGTIISPTSLLAIQQFKAKYPNTKHIQYDPISYSGILLANEATFGQKALPSYHFGKADTVFSLAADFLGTWINPNEYANAFLKNRKITANNTVMNKQYQVEGMMSKTDTNADERATCKPYEYGKVATALYNAITSGTAPTLASENLNKLITKAANDLKKGNGLVI